MSLQALVERTGQLGMSAVALTDHNGLYGAIEFYQLCKEHGIKPIIGSQVGLADGSSLVLLARDMTGYRNLCRIITGARLRGGHLRFECELDDILAHKDGLFVLSGGKRGLISRLALNRNFEEAEAHCRWMKERLADDFYLELQRFIPWDDLLNDHLTRIANTCDVPVVASNDVHLLSVKEFSLRKVLHAIDQNTLLEQVRSAGHKQQYLKAPREMQRLFPGNPQAIENSLRIAERCNLELALGKPVFPVLEVPGDETPASHLRKLCFSGAEQLYKPRTAEVERRINYELSVIGELGFTEYFLVVKDIVEFCRREAIPCVGRGSAADSIVAYVLGITFADPIRFNLYFERFLNPERTDVPDIDLDICWKSRDRVLDYVYKRFGAEKTAMICTFSTFQSRAAIREVAKVFGLPEEEIRELTRDFPHMAKMSELDENLNTVPQLKTAYSFDKTLTEIIAISKKLAGFPRHLSIHSGGVIIAPDKLTDYTPLEKARKGIVISQYDMHSIERLGLVKMDLLGVRSLTIITDCLELARKSELGEANGAVSRPEVLKPVDDMDSPGARNGSGAPGETLPLLLAEPERPVAGDDNLRAQRPVSDRVAVRRKYESEKSAAKFNFLKKTKRLSALDMRAIPQDDPATIRMIKSGKTLGCFQLESPLVRGVLRKMRTDSIDDTVVAVAVIRPGVGDSVVKDEYILRRGGLRTTRYMHPVLESILGETHGLIIYQEQVLLIAHIVAGFTLAQGDTLRRAMTKTRDPKLMNSMQRQFLQGAEANGVPRKKAVAIWEHLQQFTGFGFNKAHAATYGILAYQTAFLKCYFPVEFMTAVLNNHGGFYGTAVYIEECRRVRIGDRQERIRLLPPDVNASNAEFTTAGTSIRVGLNPVFELSDKSKQRIVAERRKRYFRDLYDFLERTLVGEKEAEHLIRCGALRSLHPSEPLLLMKCRSYFKNARSKTRTEYLTQGLQPAPYTPEMRILSELELLGFGVSGHPLQLYDGFIPWENMTSSQEIEFYKNRRVQFTGWYVTSRLQETVTGKYMKFLSLEDRCGVCEVIFFPEVYAKYADVLRGLGPFTVIGKVQSRIKGEANLIADKVKTWPSPREMMERKRLGRQLDVFG